jgi:hypothetical protein
LFLKNISDPDYQTTVTFCRNTSATLDECITAVRKQERDLIQKRIERKRLKTVMRRMKAEDLDSDDGDDSDVPTPKRRKTNKTRRVQDKTNDVAENSKFAGELTTTEKGLLRFKGECWKKMNEKEKEFVREYNASVKHGDPLEKVAMPAGITVKTRRIRRTQLQENDTANKADNSQKKQSKETKRKAITFGLSDSSHHNEEDD